MEVNKKISYYTQQFTSLKVCVIIPTYNNARTIVQVVNSVLTYTPNIIIINDGCTDETASLIQHFKDIDIVSYADNQGKGYALRKGFEKAIELDYEYAITIDSDGQHFAYDLPLFIDALVMEGAALIMGARNLNQENVPGKSSFGNKFSNFWFCVQTLVKLKQVLNYQIRKLDLDCIL